jgi:hypothetical protein
MIESNGNYSYKQRFVKHSQSVNFQETFLRFNKIYYLYKAFIKKKQRAEIESIIT